MLLVLIGLCISAQAMATTYDEYGGWAGVTSEATGFFRVEKIDGVWWLIDPSGNAFLSKGVNHISFKANGSLALGYAPYGRATEAKYGDIDTWAKASLARLRSWNFNTVGAWSNTPTFGKGTPHAAIMHISESIAKIKQGGFPDVFSPEFQAIAEKKAKEVCGPGSEDPWLVGYFLDNELRWGPDWRSKDTLFDDFLANPEDSPGKVRLVQLVRDVYGTVDKLNATWKVDCTSFDDLMKASKLSDLGGPMASVHDELTSRGDLKIVIPKEMALLYLTQTHGSLDKINETYGTQAKSYGELFTPEFLSMLTMEISKTDLPRDMVVLGIEMVYGNLDKANRAFQTNAKSYDELLDQLLGAKTLSDVAMEVKRVQDRFLRLVAGQYFRVCHDAVRAVDPNHLILGCRFAGYCPTEVAEGMKQYVDVVSYNHYGKLPAEDKLKELHRITGRPLLITEFSFKAMDSGHPNTKGAGSPVATQQDRADGFTQYVQTLMAIPSMVGYHWFEHTDQPFDGRGDGEDCNYGLVNLNDEPWDILVNQMTKVNAQVEQIHARSAAKVPPVPPGHPRVYVRPSDLPAIREKVESSEFQKSWELVRKSDSPFCRAFVYLVTGDEEAARQAIDRCLETFDKHGDNPDRVGRHFLNLIHLGACVYDWCYGVLTEDEKSEFIRQIQSFAASHGPGYPADPSGHAVVGHDTEGWLMTGQLPAGIAIYDESKEMYDAAALLFFREFVPVRNYLYRSHMHHQGDSYIATRFQHDQAASWLFRRIGAGDVFTREQQFVPYQFVYHLRPDRQQMRSGDTFNQPGNDARKRLIAMMTGCYYDDPYLMSMADAKIFHHYGADGSVLELLFRKPGAEKRPLGELPFTKYFTGPMGEMVARTGWDSGVNSNDTVVQMRIGETFFGNHQCKDFGTFQIYHRGPLAISTGVYDDYGNAHWKNYLHQTISKNGLLILDPSEVPRKGTANDGGQRWPQGSDHPRNLEVLLADDYQMGHVTAHAFGPDSREPDYSYIAGNITNAYAPQKVSHVSRSMVTLNTRHAQYPCVFVVMDRIVATDPVFKKTWLLHSIQEPQIDGKRVTVVRDGKAHGGGSYSGKLVADSLLPQQVSVTKIGGLGKEFWIESTQTNYAAELKRDAVEPGAWRVEISPSGARASDVLLHVLAVMDADTAAPPQAQTIESNNLVGAQFLDRVVLFGRDEERLQEIEFVLGGEGKHKLLVCDLAAGVWSVDRDGTRFATVQVTEGSGCAYFDGMPGRYSLVRAE